MATKTLPQIDAVEEIVRQNSGRDTRVLARKYLVMSTSPFAFFRATANLFYAHMKDLGLPLSPVGWICGDLHVENFGVYKGANRVEYFDINDFDESCFGPLLADVLRLAASIMLASEELGLEQFDQDKLALQALQRYREAMDHGRVYWCEYKTSSGAIKALFEQIKSRKRVDFLNRRTVVKRRVRTLVTDGTHYLQCSRNDEKPEAIAKVFSKMAAPEPHYFEFRDMAYRVAGLGSLGLRRYGILLRGKGDPDKNQIFDMKAGAPSSAASLMPTRQPKWATEAERIVTLQGRVQAVPVAGLSAARISRRDYVIRELQPVEDRLNLTVLAKQKLKDHASLGRVFEQMGRMAAWAHLRNAARQLADGPDTLTKYAAKADPIAWLELARTLKACNNADFTSFKAAYAANDQKLAATLKG